MDWKNFIRPTKGKIILSLVVAVLSYLFTFVFRPFCKMCAELQYENWPDIISTCNCTVGQNFPQFLFEVFIVFALPFILTYMVYSIISTFIHKNKHFIVFPNKK